MSRRDFSGRRITDARSWYEGDEEDAVAENNWVKIPGGFCICPRCAARGLSVDNPSADLLRGLQSVVFCDRCNPQGVRLIENRREGYRSDQSGRRLTDGREWIDYSSPEALLEQNWVLAEDGKHYCPQCSSMAKAASN